MKILILSNTALFAFLLAGTPLLLAGFLQTHIKTAAHLPANQGIKQVPAKVLDRLLFMGESTRCLRPPERKRAFWRASRRFSRVSSSKGKRIFSHASPAGGTDDRNRIPPPKTFADLDFKI
jgi:hypothetical protein